MRASNRIAAGGIAAVALVVGVVGPAGAQETLGFEIDPTEGPPGDVVNGQVDTGDVAEHCVTDLEEFQARFEELGELIIDEQGELFARFFDPVDPSFENHDQLAYGLLVFTALGVALNLEGAAEGAFPQTFIMTFADIATQEPVGELGNFDPSTGEGSVVVPDIEPGFWAVAATCVGPSFDLDVLEAGIRAGGAFLADLDTPFGPDGLFSPEFIEWAEGRTGEVGFDAVFAFLGEVGPSLLQPIMVPDALGAQIFCIFDEEGVCPEDEVTPPVDGVVPPTAEPVVVEPVFTG